jgi:hypothetical protein
VKKLAGTALIAAVMIALSGCATAGPAPEITEMPTELQEPVATPTGITLEDLRAMYVAAGGECEEITPRDVTVAEEAGDCDGGALLTTYESETARDAAIFMLEGLQDTNPSPHDIAVGPDWIVNGADAASFATAMGGTTRHIGD